MSMTSFGFPAELGMASVLVDGNGNGSLTVRLRERFANPPQLLLVDNRADIACGATYTSSSISAAGFTVTVAGSQVRNEFVSVRWAAVEKG